MSKKSLRLISKGLIEWKYVIALISAIIIIASASLISASLLFQPALGTLFTFWISFSVGIIGAGVYLMLLLMTERKLKMLDNDIIKNLPLMTLLFIMSGGFVSAIIQTSIGILSPNGLQAVFMIGFGWQGALSGAGASGSIKKIAQDYLNESQKIIDDKDVIISSIKNQLEDAKNDLKKLLEKDMKTN